MTELKVVVPNDSHVAATARLFERGLSVSTAIDVGSADGDFLLFLKVMGVLGSAACFNVDANPTYEESLREARDVAGIGFHIGPLAATSGPVAMTQGAHSYWASLRRPDESYWRGSGMQAQGSQQVKAATLDELVREHRLAGPFLLKFDVQGGELEVLKGAGDVLKDTAAIVIEVHREDFSAVHAHLDAAGFELLDIADLHRNVAGHFAWLYGIYLERSRLPQFAAPIWNPEKAAAVLAHQHEHRAIKLERNAQMLKLLRGQR